MAVMTSASVTVPRLERSQSAGAGVKVGDLHERSHL